MSFAASFGGSFVGSFVRRFFENAAPIGTHPGLKRLEPLSFAVGELSSPELPTELDREIREFRRPPLFSEGVLCSFVFLQSLTGRFGRFDWEIRPGDSNGRFGRFASDAFSENGTS